MIFTTASGISGLGSRLCGLLLLIHLGAIRPGLAFPPAPSHTVFGILRDEQGVPIPPLGAEVLLEAGGVVVLRAPVTAVSESGSNYRFSIPMDSGVTADLYQPTALRPTVPFRMRVKLGSETYLPIQLQGVEHLLTRPGAASRVDLTLGVDSDGDGLPDAWERTLIQAGGGKGTLEDIDPKDDTDGDGLGNLEEYFAGTYAFDPKDGFALTLRAAVDGQAELEFTAIRGHRYSIEGSYDLSTWEPVFFELSDQGEMATRRDSYDATEVRLVRVHVAPPSEGIELLRFFRLVVHW